MLATRLRAALVRLNPTLPAEAINNAIDEITRNRSAMLLEAANREVYGLLKEGIVVSVPDHEHGGQKTERLIKIIQHVEAAHYVSGPSARDYLAEEQFAAARITLEYMRYDYPEYPQLYPPFQGRVSVLDALFMLGPAAGEAIWGGNQIAPCLPAAA